MRRLLGILVILAATAAAVVLTGAAGGSDPKGRTYYIEFDNAFGLTEGGDLKVGGVRAGKTTKFTLSGNDPVKALVTVKISEKGFDSFREDATCEIRQQSLIGEYFVECQQGVSKKEIKDGGTVPVEQTTSTVPFDLVNNVMRRPYRERFRLILSELGVGLAGNPENLSAVLRRAHPGFRETSRTLRILGNQTRTIKNFIRDSDTVVRELERRKTEVSRWVRESGETAEITASRKAEFQQQWNRLPVFLRELEPTMRELGRFSDAQVPLLQDLRRAAPQLTEFFDELGPFSESSRPSIRSLGEMGKVGRRALARAKEEIEQLKRFARNAPGLARPLRQLLQSLDARHRSIEMDPRARESSPPPSDPQAWREGEGFTGMEAIWNYFFWQTLTINTFDDVSHFLRVIGIESEECSGYQAGDVDEEHIKECNSWLGPYQPGTIHDPFGGYDEDPTEDGARDARFNATRANGDERRGRGEPEVKPEPGQRDISKPQITLPPEIQELVDKMSSRGPRRAPDQRGPSDEQLLDFLLAP